METYQTKIEKLAHKLGLSVSTVKDIIACEHELKFLTDKKKLVNININIDDSSLKLINKVSKALNVSKDAVVVSALIRGCNV